MLEQLEKDRQDLIDEHGLEEWENNASMLKGVYILTKEIEALKKKVKSHGM